MDSKIRVMHLLQSSKYSGAENVVCQIMELYRDDAKYEMVYVSRDGPIREVLEERGINHLLLKDFSQSQIDKAIKTINPDIIHAHGFNASVKSRKYNKKKIISHLHNDPTWLSKLNLKTITYAYCSRYYNKIIGVSSSVLEEFIFRNLIKDKFAVLPNVVNADRVQILAQENIDEKVDILFVGRMTTQKNPLSVLRILEKLRLDVSFHAVMIGEGPLYDTVNDYIIEHHLGDFISLHGFEGNPYKYMKKAKVLLMPSLYEGFGLVAVESMLLGTPVVAYPVGGLNDIIDPECGFLCKDESELVVALKELLNSEGMQKAMGENAIIKAQKYADIGKYKEDIGNIYDSVLKI